ncbi:MAG: helix-turn-helix domain-containing protein [Paludibacteraceae bacterium]|nr:helix-turn-helix domain-containing protein [Paludibacteraceae bacterium]
MNVRIKVQNLPPAPEPTKPYHTPPEPPRGYDKGFAFFRRDIDRIKPGMYGVSDVSTDEESQCAVQKKKAVPQKDKETREFLAYMRKHTRKEAAKHYGIDIDALDRRIRSLRKKGIEVSFVAERVKFNEPLFVKDLGKMPIEDVANKHGVTLRTAQKKIQIIRERGDHIEWFTRMNSQKKVYEGCKQQ